MYGDLEIYVFSCAPDKMLLVRSQWIDNKFNDWACKEYMSSSKIKTFDSRVKQKVLNYGKR